MTTVNPITVYVCGPSLSGEVLNEITVRDGALVWEDGTEPAPQPWEQIRAVHLVPVESGLVLLVTDAGWYLATTGDLPDYRSLLATYWPTQNRPAAANETPDETDAR